jgi:hypothetical protein
VKLLHCSKENYLLSETSLVEDAYLESQQHVGFRPKGGLDEDDPDHCGDVFGAGFDSGFGRDDGLHGGQHGQVRHDDIDRDAGA